ncbi:hypothetical protein [Micromonospora zhanjiangensis]|uniref:Uncharacterized protein n=1 Tax=Micromonospora zhanjiangensis TaxID=1522057 RepID=A0ABV8KEB6_9ACTN
MRLTVGPLPSAVYWRRRAVVLGAGLLFLIVLLYSCGGPGDSGDKPKGAGGSPTPTVGSTKAGPTPDPGGTTSPGAGEASPGAGSSPGGDQSGDSAQGGPQQVGPPQGGGVVDVPNVPPPAPGSCTDSEMSLIVSATPSAVQRGEDVPVKLGIKIKNISNRTCSRDVGPDLQELFIKIGAQRVWSSDTCGTGRGSDVRSFPPGQENEYGLDWNGRESSRCGGGVAAGDRAGAGQYQVFARLGTKLSAPVKLTISD